MSNSRAAGTERCADTGRGSFEAHTQARDLDFILVGQNLEIVARDCLCQRQPGRQLWRCCALALSRRPEQPQFHRMHAVD